MQEGTVRLVGPGEFGDQHEGEQVRGSSLRVEHEGLKTQGSRDAKEAFERSRNRL